LKIALIKPPGTYANWYKRPLLGLAYISASLESQGIDSRIFDAYYHGWSEKQLLDRIKEFGPDIVGFTAMTHEIGAAGQIAEQIKQNNSNIKFVVGGCHVTALPERTLAEYDVFDYGIYGEGEKTTVELVEYLQNGKAAEPGDINGLVYRNNGNIVVNKRRDWMTSEELDELAMPAFHHYYRDNKALSGKNSCYVMFTSRGCPYNCAFCMQVLGHKVRRRSPENIWREIKLAVEQYGAHTIDFADEIFLSDNPHTREFLHLLIDKKSDRPIRWTGLTRANMVTSEIIALAKQAGCCKLEMGVESGDDDILDVIGKKITTEQIRNAVKIIRQADIPLGTYYILGHPNETEETVRKTIDLAVELNTDTIAVGIMVPYPGTRIYEMACKGQGGYQLLSEDWSKYDKYGGRALKIDGLSYKLLEKYQKKALLNLYIKNFRLMDLVKYVWRVRKALYFFLKRRIIKY